jgi:phosphatidylserine synthase
LIAIVGLIYGFVAILQAWQGKWPLAIVFGGYALSNIGLLKMTL